MSQRVCPQLVTPLSIMAVLLVACDNTVPPPADTAAPSHAEVTATPPAPPSPPPELPGPYFRTPAPGEELPTSQTTPGLVPLDYRHVWAIDRRDCTADASPTRIAISPGSVRSSEGRAVISSTDESRPGILVLHTDRIAGEKIISETHTLALSDGGKTLSYARGDANLTYMRCE